MKDGSCIMSGLTGAVYDMVGMVFWEQRYKAVITMSSLPHIHPPTSTTVLSSTCQTPASCDELSCA